MIWNVASTRDEISLRKWSGGTGFAYLGAFRGTLVPKNAFCWQQCLISLTFFAYSIKQEWANLFNRKVICRNQKHQRAAKPVCNVNKNTVKNVNLTLIDVQ